MIDSKSGGNKPVAAKASASFGDLFKSMQSMSFEGDDKYASKDFLTYCHQGKDGFTFLCQVPGMRKYKDVEAKKALSQLAWTAANIATKEIPGFNAENSITVGLRGITIYGSILHGKAGSQDPAGRTDQEILYKNFDPASAVVE